MESAAAQRFGGPDPALTSARRSADFAGGAPLQNPALPLTGTRPWTVGKRHWAATTDDSSDDGSSESPAAATTSCVDAAGSDGSADAAKSARRLCSSCAKTEETEPSLEPETEVETEAESIAESAVKPRTESAAEPRTESAAEPGTESAAKQMQQRGRNRRQRSGCSPGLADSWDRQVLSVPAGGESAAAVRVAPAEQDGPPRFALSSSGSCNRDHFGQTRDRSRGIFRDGGCRRTGRSPLSAAAAARSSSGWTLSALRSGIATLPRRSALADSFCRSCARSSATSMLRQARKLISCNRVGGKARRQQSRASSHAQKRKQYSHLWT